MPPKKNSKRSGSKKIGLWKKVKKHGPALGAGALALGGIAAAAYLSSPKEGGAYPEKPPSDTFQSLKQKRDAETWDAETWAQQDVFDEPQESMFDAVRRMQAEAEADFP